MIGTSVSAPAGEAHTVHGRRVAQGAVFSVIMALSFSHFLNDMMQSLVPALYPMWKSAYGLSFAQIGLISLVTQVTSSMLQPAVGLFSDHRPQPYSLAAGMGATLIGLLLLASAGSYPILMLAAALVGIGSAVFHPEASRVARLASGGRHGLAQSLFQVGGNTGQALGPLAAALVVVRWGQSSVAFFALLLLFSGAILWNVGSWYKHHGLARLDRGVSRKAVHARLPRSTIVRGIAVLLALIFSKYVYLTSLTSYYTFYLIDHFALSVQAAQLYLFVFLAAIAVGTILGGPIGDRFGRKRVIWLSIVGALPFTLLLPYASLFWTGPLTVVIGLPLASAFPAIVVFAQELVPGKVGMISGLFFGLAFGAGGIGAAWLGALADATSLEHVYRLCAFLPLIGLLAALLPDAER